jgi:hypothetical protein
MHVLREYIDEECEGQEKAQVVYGGVNRFERGLTWLDWKFASSEKGCGGLKSLKNSTCWGLDEGFMFTLTLVLEKLRKNVRRFRREDKHLFWNSWCFVDAKPWMSRFAIKWRRAWWKLNVVLMRGKACKNSFCSSWRESLLTSWRNFLKFFAF